MRPPPVVRLVLLLAASLALTSVAARSQSPTTHTPTVDDLLTREHGKSRPAPAAHAAAEPAPKSPPLPEPG